MSDPSDTTPLTLTLRQVAAWDLEHLNDPNSRCKASVPALQRGLVWSPQQVELLWDSILRGFPIGSLVVAKPDDKQERVGADGTKKSGITHHLLDGQQRSNAITLGFHDPFNEAISQVRGNVSESILWLDLAPYGIPDCPPELEADGSQYAKNSTRQYLTRVTTKAHPWGYHSDDQAGTLSAGAARGIVKWEYEVLQQKPIPKQRSLPTELLPAISNAPVPMAWLLEAGRQAQATADQFWDYVMTKLEERSQHRGWPRCALTLLQRDREPLTPIYLAVQRTLATKLVILEAPETILDDSEQERTGHGGQGISNIEHLFHRLNRQGKVLDGEELAYSLIKAYWPKVADVVEKVKLRRVPASQLVAMAVRVALTDDDANKLANGLSIRQLRALASEQADQKPQRQKIETFLGCGDSSASDSLAEACQRVDRWLSYDTKDHQNGLPPVLVSSFARKQSDLYTLLLRSAHVMDAKSDDSAWREVMPGVVTLLHWFTKPGMTGEVASLLFQALTNSPTLNGLRAGLRDALPHLILPLHPDELEKAIQPPEDDSLMNWKWWRNLVEQGTPEELEKRQQNLWPFLERTRGSRELLLYAQRHYLASRFSDYDPSRRDLWEAHNRPWDFDHLHASAYFTQNISKNSGDYHEVCREWGNCIGNLRAWPFEDNRSDSKEPLNKKLEGKLEAVKDSFLKGADLAAFSKEEAPRYHLADARYLCEAIRARYVAIYREWYSSAGIAKLVGEIHTPSIVQ